MLLHWIVCGIAWLAFTNGSVFASVRDENNETQSSVEMIFDRLRVPWIEGLNWLVHSAESPDLEEVRAWIRGVESSEPWALKILDDLAELQREDMERKIAYTEKYSQCSEISAQNNDTHTSVERDLNSLVHSITDMGGKSSDSACSSLENQRGEEVNAEPRTPKASENFSTGEIFTLYFFLAITAFMFICTICDFIRRLAPSYQSSAANTLAEFSLYTNATKLLRTKATRDDMRAIHGLRFLSCCMITGSHHFTMLIVLLREKISIVNILEWRNSWLMLFVTSAIPAVDTFFVISGFLLGYTFLKTKKSGIKFNLLTMYIQRYFRLTPCIGVILLFVVNLLHRVGGGNLWQSSYPPTVEVCQEKWWLNILYIQNIVSRDNLCLCHTWYAAIDMQLFWISPIVLYPLHRRPKIGLAILCLLVATSVAASTIILVVDGYSNALSRLDIDLPTMVHDMFYYYMSTVRRVFPYFIGILLGYDLTTNERRPTKFNVAINWILATCLVLFSIWANHRIHNSNFAYDLPTEVVFAILIRPAWSIAMAWIIYACTQGYGGVVTRILSLPLFVPLSRLTYCFYLLHMLVQGFMITHSKIPTRFSKFELSYGIFGETILLIFLSLILHLFVEAPVNVLMKMLMNRGQKEKAATMVQERCKDGEKLVLK